MKKLLRILVLVLVLAVLWRLPFRGVDVAKLIPVKTVVVTRSGDAYTVDVGAGVRGVGRTLSDALADLRDCVSGEIFFPTAEQVIVAEPEGPGTGLLEAVAEEPSFRPAAGVYRSPEAEPDAEAVGKYLQSHPADTTIMDLRAALRAGEAPKLPLILSAHGGYRIAEPESR